eukprot:6175674-Pleurochrysis_carterae.AAC.1
MPISQEGVIFSTYSALVSKSRQVRRAPVVLRSSGEQLISRAARCTIAASRFVCFTLFPGACSSRLDCAGHSPRPDRRMARRSGTSTFRRPPLFLSRRLSLPKPF